MRVEMSSFDIAVIALELDRALKGFRIDNIYQLNPKTILLKLRGGEGLEKQLLVEAGRRVHLTSYIMEKPLKPPSFCMALRKYLRGGRIGGVEQYRFERILEIKVSSHTGEYSLVVELFGQGNVILVGPDKRILHALCYKRMRDRNILRGEIFAYPPPKGKDPTHLAREDMDDLKVFGQIEVMRAMARFLGISGTYVEEILLRASIPKDKVCSSLEGEDLDSIFNSLQEILSEISLEKEKPSIVVGADDEWVDVIPIELKKYSQFKTLQFESFNEALDEYYAKVSVAEKVSNFEEEREQKLAKLERILRGQEEALRKAENDAEAFRRKGDAIYRHLNEVQQIIEEVMNEKRSGKRWEEIIKKLREAKKERLFPTIYFEDLKPEVPMLRISLEGETIDIDLKLSAQRNAAKYYDEAKKAEKKAEGAKAAMLETKRKIEETRLRMAEAMKEAEEPLMRVRKKEWYEKYRWFYSSDGFLVVAGKDAYTNEALIKRNTEPKDIILHADVSGAPFTVIKTHGVKPPEQTIMEASQFAASYSSAWKSGFGTVDVYWVSPEQVSKTPPSGEYLPRGSFMVYGTKNYVRNLPLEIAVGVKKEEDSFKVISGPPGAIAKQTNLFVTLVPGAEQGGRLAKKIRSKLSQLALEKREEILKIPLDEIQRLIPFGQGEIKKLKEGTL